MTDRSIITDCQRELNSWAPANCDIGKLLLNILTTAPARYFMECQPGNLYLSLSEAGFRDFNWKGCIFLPKLLVDFSDVFRERFFVILNRSGGLCAHYWHTVEYEATQLERY